MSFLQPVRAAIGAAILAILAASPLRAQQNSNAADSARADSARKKSAHEMPMNMPMGTNDSATTMKAAAKARVGASSMASMVMMTGALGIPMERMGSGTTWLPDAVSLPSRHIPARGWDVMLHGFVFGQYDAQGGPRGDRQIGSLNWGMFMASHELAGGRFQARTMLSAEYGTPIDCARYENRRKRK